MSKTPEPIGTEEFVLRRIHKNHTAPGPTPSILPVAFRPSKADSEGLSIFRQPMISPAEVAAAGRKPGEYYVASLSVQALHTLCLTVIAADRPEGPPGHALIPELNFDAYEKSKEKWKSVLVELARLAGQSIVHRPDD